MLVSGYFDFSSTHRNLWAALHEHRVPEGMAMAQALIAERVHLTDIIGREVAAVLPGKAQANGAAVELFRIGSKCSSAAAT